MDHQRYMEYIIEETREIHGIHGIYHQRCIEYITEETREIHGIYHQRYIEYIIEEHGKHMDYIIKDTRNTLNISSKIHGKHMQHIEYIDSWMPSM